MKVYLIIAHYDDNTSDVAGVYQYYETAARDATSLSRTNLDIEYEIRQHILVRSTAMHCSHCDNCDLEKCRKLYCKHGILRDVYCSKCYDENMEGDC